MASLKDIRRRISSVKNTQQITRAMKMIAAVKLRKAQDQILAARPYARELITVISNLALHAEGAGGAGGRRHRLLTRKPPNRVGLVVVTSDRGLCGSYNGNIIRTTEKFIREKGREFKGLKVSFIGRKGHDYFKKRLNKYPNASVNKYYSDVMAKPTFDHAVAVADDAMKAFKKDHLDHVYFIYNEFKTAISQKVVVETLLPVAPAKEEAGKDKTDYLYEPSRKGVLKTLLPKHVRVQVYRILLEASSSEHGARMTAMDAATTNAGEMISKLTLVANRVRQAAITKELMEIVSGAEALKG